MKRFSLAAAFWCAGFLGEPAAQTFLFPTANRALLELDGQEKFFVGTPGRDWTSGDFGCVRSDGFQMHEGIDIRCLERDRDNEPLDSIVATADGFVAYSNDQAGLSNYGKYVVLRHNVEGIEIYSLYAHLRSIAEELVTGRRVKQGEKLGVMGRTANTRSGISKDRAHLHFELNLFVNERFPQWYAEAFPGQRNDHGQWNGQNLLGLDPSGLLLAQHREGEPFHLLSYLRNQPELCRVFVPATAFPWLKRYTPLIRRNPTAEKEGVAGYEIALNFNGVPFQLIPRASSEIMGSDQIQLLSVNEGEAQRHPCRSLVVQNGKEWKLGRSAIRLLELLTY